MVFKPVLYGNLKIIKVNVLLNDQLLIIFTLVSAQIKDIVSII